MNTIQIAISGIVQGVGFRPFVYKHAVKLGLNGYIKNTLKGVEIVIQGLEENIGAFLTILHNSPPPHSAIETIKTARLSNQPVFSSFLIDESAGDGGRIVRVSPDLAVCPDCLRELFDPHDRRYLYPYINCTNCGPRFTIVRDIPYDRVKTTMAAFAMCKECEREYTDPLNRRFHAQPTACHECGPHVSLVKNNGELVFEGKNHASVEKLIQSAVVFLKNGNILGIKGLGGFHIACNATDSHAIANLRRLKLREEKSFALMVKDVSMARKIVHLSETEEARLITVGAPILLLGKRKGNQVAEAVAPKSRDFGVMLPYTPLQHLIFQAIDFPLVMTSANFSDEPIVYRNEEALSYLGSLCDYFILGERDIFIRTDDSVMRLWDGKDYLMRRSRGFVPNPVMLDFHASKPVLAVGAEMKNTISIISDTSAFVSHHIGDLKNRETYQAFLESVLHFTRLVGVTPEIIAHDLHPQYLSTQFAIDPPPGFEWVLYARKIAVQHHHAHIAGCMAENNLTRPVIGVALDGTGFGSDETIWGGEILIADLKKFERRAFLEQVVIPGGDLAVKEPWRMALSYLYAVFGNVWHKNLPPSLAGIPEQKLIMTITQLEKSASLPLASSCGRLFDAISALSGVCCEAHYEGQPAIELEQALVETHELPYQFSIIEKADVFVLSWRNVIREVIRDIKQGKPAGVISDRFHLGLANCISDTAALLAKQTGIKHVVLTGGCFMNMFLLKNIVQALNKNGLCPVFHSRIPCNDGGISLGQAVIAALCTA